MQKCIHQLLYHVNLQMSGRPITWQHLEMNLVQVDMVLLGQWLVSGA